MPGKRRETMIMLAAVASLGLLAADRLVLDPALAAGRRDCSGKRSA